MTGNPLRDLLNRIRWEPDRSGGEVVLVFVSREGGTEREESVPFISVREIGAHGVVVADGTFLPYHRLTAVRRGDAFVWRARGEEAT